MKSYLIIVAICLLSPVMASAELSLPNIFSDHMVLQRERTASIWGTATPGSRVRIDFKGQQTSVDTNTNGHWRVGIPTGKADGKGATLTIQSGSQTVAIKDVMVGEVWLASGQSNMVFSMNRVPAYAEIIATSAHPEIRMFNAQSVTAVEPQNDIEGQWSICSPASVPGYSAVAFFFARKLHEELGVPIGVIKSAWGGKPVETFTSREALLTLPETKALVEATLKADAAYDEVAAQAAYKNRLARWKTVVTKQKAQPTTKQPRPPRRPAAPKRPLLTEGKPGVLFNSMIYPFVPLNWSNS